MKSTFPFFVLVFVCILTLAGCGVENQTPAPTNSQSPPTLTETSTVTLPPTITQTFTPTLTATLTPTFTFTPTITPTPGIGVVWTSPVDGTEISYVPAGEFVMGAEIQEDWDFCAQFEFPGCEDTWFETGNPVHKVYLDEFWMYQTEVTNAQFAGFLNEVGNQIEDGRNWLDAWSEYVQIHLVSGSWRVDTGYDDIPVVEVTWYGAAAYCDWVGARLPTEAEWEKAARGGLERKVYPWGNVLGDNLANFCDMNCKGTFANLYFDDGYSSIAPIRSYSPNGYGLFDMAGNVSEWVADWYDRYYYEYSPYLNPTGPENGFSRVVRGGSSGSIQEHLQVATRYHEVPWISRLSIGFRCVFSGSP